MAQVKFYNVSADTYSGYGEQGGKGYDSGAIYFIKDNGEIRKGDKHVTGTRVYTATDLSGTTAVESLDIEFNGTSISGQDFPTDDLPKKGDMLVVEHVLTTISETHWELNDEVVPEGTEGAEEVTTTTPDKVEYAAYIYAANGGTYSASEWQACDGNVDASKVILTQNITMAGSYDKIGNFDKGDAATNKADFLEGGNTTAGVSVYELIKQMLQKTVNPTVKSTPTTGTSSSYSPSGAQEYGTPVTATYIFSLVDGEFTNGKGQDVNAGCTATGYNVTDGTDATSNSGSYQFTAGVTASKTVSATVDYTANSTIPTDNFDQQVPSVNISAGTTESKSITLSVSSYRNVFYKAIPFDSKMSEEDIKALTSADIRANGSGWTKNSSKPTSWAYTNKAQFIILVPSSDTKKITKAETANKLPFTFTKLKAANGTDDFTISINGYGDTAETGTNYVVWVDNEGMNTSDTINITWG